MERAKGFEPSTPTLARLYSTPELRPLIWQSSYEERVTFIAYFLDICNIFFTDASKNTNYLQI